MQQIALITQFFNQFLIIITVVATLIALKHAQFIVCLEIELFLA
jgi:hypothetical protein